MSENFTLMKKEFRRCEEVIFADDEGQLALFHPTTGAFYSLNEIGELVWLQLRDWSSLADLSKRVAVTFDVQPEVVENDLIIFLNKLDSRGLIEKR